jgi:dynein heavy chain
MWKALMKQTMEQPNLKTLSLNKSITENLIEANKRLDSIQKGLNSYLETKRTAFPRFYFLSNEDLLEILSQIRDPKAVQVHLRKCFENINELEFNESNTEIIAMLSLEKESIQFINPISPTGVVEGWLTEVERTMRDTIQHTIGKALATYSEETREKWLLMWPGQVILAVSQILWTRAATKAIQTNSNIQPLKAYYSLLSDQINQTVKLLRGDLSIVNRMALEALIVTDVHARDTIASLIEAEVADDGDFEWISKLRYYWENNSLVVRMVNASLDYGYEYLGNTGRLVITPLTERCCKFF